MAELNRWRAMWFGIGAPIIGCSPVLPAEPGSSGGRNYSKSSDGFLNTTGRGYRLRFPSPRSGRRQDCRNGALSVHISLENEWILDRHSVAYDELHAEWTARVFAGEKRAKVADGIEGGDEMTVNQAVWRFAKRIGLVLP